jgi:hypothetical protein
MGVPPCLTCGERIGLKTARHTQPSTHLTGHRSLKYIVQVKFQDNCGSTRRKVMVCMHMADLQLDALEFSARVIFRLQKPHPHVFLVVVDSEQAVA